MTKAVNRAIGDLRELTEAMASHPQDISRRDRDGVVLLILLGRARVSHGSGQQRGVARGGISEFDTFADACTWPDYPRRRASEHYVNLPRNADRLDEDPCPLANDCVVSAIETDLAVLSSSSATEQERLEALKYLGHWGGDIHQPLHVSFQDDRGGNAIGVSGGLCSWDLHAVWDRCIIEQGLPGDPYALAVESQQVVVG